MILVNQYLEQLTPEIRSALLNTAGSIACFRTGYQDGYELAKEIFPSQHANGFDTHPELPLFAAIWPHQFGHQQSIAEWDQLAQTISGLRFREFWHKQRGAYRPTKQRTLDMPLPKVTHEIRHNIWSLVLTCARLYSRSKETVRKEVAAYNTSVQGIKRTSANAPRENIDEDIPFWGV